MSKKVYALHATNPQAPDFALLPKILNGGIAGVVGLFCIFPLDLVKTRLQNQQISDTGEKQYKSIAGCFKKVIRQEGFLCMYRGVAVTAMLCTPEKAVKFAANDYFRYILKEPEGSLSIARQCIAGGIAGCCQVTISTPMELLKIQLQDAGRVAAAGEKAEKLTALGFTMKLVREQGFLGLYKGISATIYRDVLFSLIYFPVFATLSDLGPRKRDDSAEAVGWVSFVSGMAAGSLAAISITPFDVLKTRMQSYKKRAGERQFNGLVDCAVKTFKHEGALAFFKGGLCRMMVLSPMYGIAQVVYFLGVAEFLLGVSKVNEIIENIVAPFYKYKN